tara:strand:- start:68 stop:439 length:372 start_codon:yes stop_codon:yes gene_type:complete
MTNKPRLIQIEKRKLIYDSTDVNFYDTHSINLQDGTLFQFNHSELSKLNDEKGSFSEQDFQFMINACTSLRFYSLIPELAKYKNEEDLGVYLKKEEGHIVLIALGETQPGRYKIFIEGVFKTT